MHLDWVRENEGRDFEARKLIRRRAIQAATTTKLTDKRGKQCRTHRGQELQPWIVHGQCIGPVNQVTELLSTNRAAARLSHLPLLNGVAFSTQSVFVVPEHLVRILRSATFAENISQAIQRRSIIPDEHIKHFLVLALADANYLQAICSCYGRSACLDAAIDCLAPRVEDFLAGRASSTGTLRLYATALQLLRQAVQTSSITERFEIYYAIPLLVLFELLNASDRLALMTHARGGVHMLHLIGPSGMTSDLNKSLLAMQSDLKVTEDIQNGDSHCCSDPVWHDALRQSIRYDLPPGSMQSEANITLNIIATALPETLTSVESLVQRPRSTDTTLLAKKLATTASQLRTWQFCWVPTLQAQPSNAERKVLLATFFMCTALNHRLISSMPGQSVHRAVSEIEALNAANQALELIKAQSHEIIPRARLAIVSTFVRSVIETSDAWQRELRQVSENQTVSAALFGVWCVRMGRRMELDEETGLFGHHCCNPVGVRYPSGDLDVVMQ